MKKPIHPPGPNLFLLALMYLKAKGNPITLMSQLSKKYGDIVRFQFRRRPDYLLTSPEYIKKVLIASEEQMARSTPPAMKRFLGNGLLTSQGQFHKTQRKIFQPVFHKQEVVKMTATMSQRAETFIREWRDGQTLDIDQEMRHLTLEIVLLTLFGTNLGPERKELSDAFNKTQEAKSKNDVPLLDNLLNKLPLPRNRRLKQSLDYVDRTIYRMIEEKRRHPSQESDLLSMLLELQKNDDGQKVFTDRQIRDEAITMLASGHETIGNALTWTWYLLSQNPQAERKLHQECDLILNGRTPVQTDLANLSYTRMIFQEAMRLYPPVWIIGRRPVVDFDLNGYTIPKGSFIHISQYLVHRDPRFHKDPEVFRPERWESINQTSGRTFSYFPFGGGTRLCIGEEYAWTEGMLIIAILAQRFRLALKPGHIVKQDLCITLRSKYGMLMTLKKRKRTEEK